MRLATFAIALGLAVAPLTSQAGDMNNMMGGAQPESSMALNAAMMKMHQKMNMQMTGDADVDFVKGMIPHHEGAVDMAKNRTPVRQRPGDSQAG